MIERTFLKEAGPRMILEPLGGKMNEISESETPYPHRKGNLYNIQYTVGWSNNSKSISSQKMEWLRKLYKEMGPYVAKSPRTAYLNYRDLDFGTNQEDYSYSKAKMWGEKYFNGNFESSDLCITSELGGPPYNSTTPPAIWSPPLTRWPIPQPKFAARVGVSDSDMPQGTRPAYNPSRGHNNPVSAKHDFGQ
ncbi:hypothetical protein CQW23_30473 [Capsicum baccatum]|uniref:Berberine/berberine-like domain-containing protein n=1 Tax=Capsicum baccatum TaxID=33114 RepID=A0A2G2VAG9_CAPBA|nr:hypothetical protein CQW23_30473 [Capsicum baccatum]